MATRNVAYLESLNLVGDGWSSKSESIDNILRHLKRKTKSEGSRVAYLRTVAKFCQSLSEEPDVVVKWGKKKVEEAVQRFCDGYGDSPNVANVYLAHLTAFFYVNGFRVGKKCNLEVDSYHVPSRYRKREEYIPTEQELYKMVTVSGVGLRNRVAILLLYTAGLRNSTLRALRWKDLDEEQNDGRPLYVPIYPEMKDVEPDACKGKIPYYTFASPEVVEALNLYYNHIKSKYQIRDGQVIFLSEDRKMDLETRRFKPMSKRLLEKMVKEAARNAGVEKWNLIRPHGFRKAYERAMRNSGLDVKDQEFLMGHILPGPQEAYYDSSKIEEIREKYSKIVFFSTYTKAGKTVVDQNVLKGMQDTIQELRARLNALETS